MANPQIALGTLNRLRGSIVVPNLPQLNVTAPYLGKEGIRLRLNGKSVVYIPAMTGEVTSPEPYLAAEIMVHLLKTQGLAELYKQQVEALALIGDVVITTDASTLTQYPIVNCSISSIDELDFSGESAGYNVTLEGYYLINNQLWDQS